MKSLTKSELAERYVKQLEKAKANMQKNRDSKKAKGLRQVAFWTFLPKLPEGYVFVTAIAKKKVADDLMEKRAYPIITLNKAHQPEVDNSNWRHV